MHDRMQTFPMDLQILTIPQPVSVSGFLDLVSMDAGRRMKGLKVLRTFKTGFCKQLLKQVPEEEINKVEAEAAEAMAQELQNAQIEDIRMALTKDMTAIENQDVLAELLKVSGRLPEDVAEKVQEIEEDVMTRYIGDLENAAEANKALPPCPSILPQGMREEAEKVRIKLTSQKKFAEEMKALKDGNISALYQASILLPGLGDQERSSLQSYMEENEAKIEKVEEGLLRGLCGTSGSCKQIAGLLQVLGSLVKDGLHKSNAATVRSSPTIKNLTNMTKEDIQHVHAWHSSKCLLDGSSSNTPTSAHFWKTVSFFQKSVASWSTIFPVGEALDFKPAFFTFVKEVIELRAGEGVAPPQDEPCSWCEDGNAIDLQHCMSGKLLEVTAANLHTLIKDSSCLDFASLVNLANVFRKHFELEVWGVF